MTNLTLAKATAEEFRTFWEAHGWNVGWDTPGSRAIRINYNEAHLCAIFKYSHTPDGDDWWLIVFSSPSATCEAILDPFAPWIPRYKVGVTLNQETTTLGEALDTLNKLVPIVEGAFGLWAKEDEDAKEGTA